MIDYIISATIILVVALTTLVIIGIWKFGQFIFTQKVAEPPDKESFFRILMSQIEHNDKSYFAKSINSFVSIVSEFEERRNDFWTTYGQIIICIFIVCIIALLLLTKVISAEAGLPILSAISGFAIAKSTTIRNKSTENLNNTNG